MSRGRILVVRGGAIGDFILTFPALAALRKHFPQTHIEVLGYPRVASLAELAGYANDVRSIEARALAGFFARNGELDRALCEYFGAFNIIISYLYDPDEIFRDNIARCSKAQFIAGPHRPDEAANTHATKVFLQPLERLAIFDADSVPRLTLSGNARPGPALTLAAHPGSGSKKKNWPETSWQELLRQIATETNWHVLLVGGEAEEARLQSLASLIPLERLSVALHQPLTELAPRLARCKAFLGHDSGITHLAAALGLRGLAIWGETNPQIWQPGGGEIVLLRNANGLEKLNSALVFVAVHKLMEQPE